jgi:hypothetical protein
MLKMCDTRMLVHWVVAVNLIAPIASFSYSLDSDVKQSAGLLFRRLQVISGENPEGTLLVAVDEKWPPVRIAVQSLLDCDLEHPAGGFKPGIFLSINSSLFQTFPILTSMVQAPLSVSQPEPTRVDERQISDGPLKDSRRANQYNEVSEEEVGLRDSTNPCPQLTFRAPILLNFSYYGSQSPRVGDKMTWVYSIQQGSAPLSWITLRFYSNYLSSSISRNISVPWDFQSRGKVTTGSITYKVRSSDLSGTYILQQVVLTTQACPYFVDSNYQFGGWIYYSYNSARIKSIIGPQTHSVNLLSGYLASYVLGSGSNPTIVPPELIELRYTGYSSVAWGEDLIWEYKVVSLDHLNQTLVHNLSFSSLCASRRCGKGRTHCQLSPCTLTDQPLKAARRTTLFSVFFRLMFNQTNLLQREASPLDVCRGRCRAVLP